jgi:hypothetical protein
MLSSMDFNIQVNSRSRYYDPEAILKQPEILEKKKKLKESLKHKHIYKTDTYKFSIYYRTPQDTPLLHKHLNSPSFNCQIIYRSF